MPDIPLIFVPPKYLFDENIINDTPRGVLDYVPFFEPAWYRLPKSEDLNRLVNAINELIARLNLQYTQRVIDTPGDIVITAGQYAIIFAVLPAPVQATLPAIDAWVDDGYNFADIWIKDYANLAGTNPITVVTPDGATIDGLAQWQIGANGAGARFRALQDKSGWLVAG